MDYNLQTRLGKFAQIASALGEETDGLCEYDAACLAVEAVRQMNDDLGIPDGLKETGVKASGINQLAKTAMQSGNIAVNPRKTTLADMQALFRTAM
jgi:1,3-propanediol dehydrogenase